MFELNYADDIEEMSDEARHLARQGVIILKCYKALTCRHLKVTTRLDFEECCELVHWYIHARFGGYVTQVNIGDWVLKGDLLFSFVARD